MIYLIISPVKWALNWYKYVITANLSGTVKTSISAGSITRGIPRASPASNAFLQFPFTSCGDNESNSLYTHNTALINVCVCIQNKYKRYTNWNSMIIIPAVNPAHTLYVRNEVPQFFQRGQSKDCRWKCKASNGQRNEWMNEKGNSKYIMKTQWLWST